MCIRDRFQLFHHFRSWGLREFYQFCLPAGAFNPAGNGLGQLLCVCLLYTSDQTFDALKTSPDEIRPAGFTEAFQVHSGVDSFWLAAYHTPISDLAHPQQKIGELWVLLDLRQLESRIATWNLPQQEMTLMQGQTVLIPSPSGINEQRLDAVNTLSSTAVQPVQDVYKRQYLCFHNSRGKLEYESYLQSR